MHRSASNVAALVAALGSLPTCASAWTYQTVYAFSDGTDGGHPNRVIADSVGNLFGTTNFGGAHGSGVVFELSTAGQETVLGSFPVTSGSAFPSPLVLDARGNLDGVARIGSGGQAQELFQINPAGRPKIVYAYTSINDRGLGLTSDAKGNLYGVSAVGGAYDGGTVYKVTPSGVLTILHSFGAPGDGLQPSSTVLIDGIGNIYGVTSEVQPTSSGKGAVYKLAPDGTETILHVFSGGTKDGSSPSGNLVMNASGDLFGTTLLGGGGLGTVFEITPGGQERLIYRFPADAGQPQGLTIDTQGNLYGVFGGNPTCSFTGSVYEITSAGVYKDLYDAPSGSQLIADELAWANGNLYGVAFSCGTPAYTGSIYQLSP